MCVFARPTSSSSFRDNTSVISNFSLSRSRFLIHTHFLFYDFRSITCCRVGAEKRLRERRKNASERDVSLGLKPRKQNIRGFVDEKRSIKRVHISLDINVKSVKKRQQKKRKTMTNNYTDVFFSFFTLDLAQSTQREKRKFSEVKSAWRYRDEEDEEERTFFFDTRPLLR